MIASITQLSYSVSHYLSDYCKPVSVLLVPSFISPVIVWQWQHVFIATVFKTDRIFTYTINYCCFRELLRSSHPAKIDCSYNDCSYNAITFCILSGGARLTLFCIAYIWHVDKIIQHNTIWYIFVRFALCYIYCHWYQMNAKTGLSTLSCRPMPCLFPFECIDRK